MKALDMREVTLEILRHGRPHNQLLSPLTEYLALSGKREAATVRVNMEHRDVLMYMRSLRYEAKDNGLRQIQLGRLGAELAEILGAVPGLLAELAACSHVDLVHLRLISSAAELALLPFELLDAPPGFPGEGYPMSLQLELPLVITREVSGAFGSRYHWPENPKLLFAAASPPGVDTVPFDAHLLALTKAIREVGARETSDLLVKILPQASVAEIRRACETEQFTHVHILAHGAGYEEGGQQRFGLVLHGEPGTNPVDIVSAERLEAALHPHSKGDAKRGWRCNPAVVSIASCDSGNVSQVVIPGGSVAHTLHVAGVPLVVASQFPLSKRGSVMMTELLYTGLLGGEDPRKVLHNVRRQLRSLRGEHHDWASMVAYASLPDDLEQQLKKVRYVSAKRGIEAAMDRLDVLAYTDMSELTETEVKEVEKLREEATRHAGRMPGEGHYRTEALGMLASTQKRVSESFFRIALRLSPKTQAKRRAELLSESVKELRAARTAYLKASIGRIIGAKEPEKGQLHWVLCQYLALEVVLGGSLDGQYLTTALSTAQMTSRYNDNPEDVAWAIGTLAELELLSILDHGDSAVTKARDYVEELLKLNVSDRFIYYSTKRQLARYAEWWGDDIFKECLLPYQSRISGLVVDTAKDLCNRLGPFSDEYKKK